MLTDIDWTKNKQTTNKNKNDEKALHYIFEKLEKNHQQMSCIFSSGKVKVTRTYKVKFTNMG